MQKVLYTEIGPDGQPYQKGKWKEFVIHNEKEVRGFFGPYRFLSNFWPAHVNLDTVDYPSVELAYQAAKWRPENRNFFLTCTELESIDYNGINIPDGYSKEQWEAKKFQVMKDLLKQKFDPILNPENHQKLLATENKYLEEMNWWNDLYWGTDKAANGQNMLGKLLMEIRQEFSKISN